MLSAPHVLVGDHGLLRAPLGHTGRPRRVFRHAHVAPENGFNLISPLLRRNSARPLHGFFLILVIFLKKFFQKGVSQNKSPHNILGEKRK